MDQDPKPTKIESGKAALLFAKTFSLVFSCKTILDFTMHRRISIERFLDPENIRLAIAISGMKSSYSYLKNRIGHYAAGAFSSFWLLFDPSKSRRISVALNMFVRAALFGIRATIYCKDSSDADEKSNKNLKLRALNSRLMNFIAKIIHINGDLIQWFAVAFHICFCAFNYPQILPKGYYVLNIIYNSLL